jgi:hypothetical protein
VVSQADGEGLVILPSDLSARCRAEALLFVGVVRKREPQSKAPPNWDALYFALARTRLLQSGTLNLTIGRE